MLKSFRCSIKDTHFEGICRGHLFAAEKRPFSWLGELPVLTGNPEPPKNPSNLPQNRLKSLRRTCIPPRQKLALYGALKRAVKILWILLPSKCRYKYINNQSFSLASTDLERVGLTILQILQILQAETRQGVSWLYNYIISIITLIQL